MSEMLIHFSEDALCPYSSNFLEIPKIIKIYYTQLTTFELGTFRCLKNLKEVTFHYNKLSIIQEGLFYNNRYLETLDLRFNLIKKFEININNFDGFKFFLDLSSNKLEYLENKYFYFLAQGTNKKIQIIMRNNNFNCLCSNIKLYARYGLMMHKYINFGNHRCEKYDIKYNCIINNICSNYNKKFQAYISNTCNFPGFQYS